MEWQDRGVILNLRRHGESSAVVEIFTHNHGRHLGLVRSARSKLNRPVLQPGNEVAVTWRARLEDHLGNWQIEATKLRAAFLMEDRNRLDLSMAILSHAALIAERDPHEDIALAIDYLFDRIEIGHPVLADFVRYEMMILQTLGFGLDLTACAATGAQEALTHVSPKSGRAVSETAAAPYANRLLKLPPFLLGGENPNDEQVLQGLRLTGFFLACHVYEPRKLPPPEGRQRIIQRMETKINAAIEAKEAIRAKKD